MTFRLYTPDPKADEEGEEEDEEEAPSGGLADDPPHVHATKEEEAAWVRRLDEESRCQEILRRAEWLDWLPIHHAKTYNIQEAQLFRECTNFVESF